MREGMRMGKVCEREIERGGAEEGRGRDIYSDR